MKLVSSCLAGVNCKYNGGNNANEKVIALVKGGKAIHVCPEQLGGLPTPREVREIKDGKVVTKSGVDETAGLKKGAVETLRIAKEAGVTEAILKARSPSCGKGKVYDGSFSGKLVEGNGVTTELLLKNGIKIVTEEEI